ncbi:MAG: MBL fold metallo-hydrolase, partial [FCB group bacterium]|nr:MBL fold metallo-hydrolase [FCB group bacterium]
MRFGNFQIHIINDGLFRLDGGAMFGVVPKVLWSKTEEVDDRNRILMSCNPLLVRNEEYNLLIDTGIGEKNDDKFTDIYAVDLPRKLIPELKRLGLKPEDITHVVGDPGGRPRSRRVRPGPHPGSPGIRFSSPRTEAPRAPCRVREPAPSLPPFSRPGASSGAGPRIPSGK